MNSYQLIYHSARWNAEMEKGVFKRIQLHSRCEVTIRTLLWLDRVLIFQI
jgi:hypothetical protein